MQRYFSATHARAIWPSHFRIFSMKLVSLWMSMLLRFVDAVVAASCTSNSGRTLWSTCRQQKKIDKMALNIQWSTRCSFERWHWQELLWLWAEPGWTRGWSFTFVYGWKLPVAGGFCPLLCILCIMLPIYFQNGVDFRWFPTFGTHLNQHPTCEESGSPQGSKHWLSCAGCLWARAAVDALCHWSTDVRDWKGGGSTNWACFDCSDWWFIWVT